MLPARIAGLSSILVLLAGMCLAAIMGLTAADVIGRYLFNAPLKGAYEMTQLLLAAMIFSALPAVAQRREHITVELLPTLPGRARQLQVWTVAMFSAAVLAVLAWRLALLAARMVRLGDRSPELSAPLGFVAYGMSAAIALACIVTLISPLTAPAEASQAHGRSDD